MSKYPFVKTCVRCHQTKDRIHFKQGMGTYQKSDVCNDCSPARKKYHFGGTLVVKGGEERPVIKDKNHIPDNSYYYRLADESIKEETVKVDHKE
tara:strand:- start:2116 stop:2397 length:282 start_codon:yes stop_codon:yes gene_type:complete